MESAINQAIAENKAPGGVLWLEHKGSVYHRAFGRRALVPQEEPASEDTIYDAASLTKVIATTPATMLLVERGQIFLDAPVSRWIPEFATRGKEKITIRHLLTHTSGLRPGLSRATSWTGREKAIELACAEPMLQPAGTVFRYSDINFILLGEVLRRASGTNLEHFVADHLYAPLKMRDTGYLPSADKLARIAPTESQGQTMLRGTVHDPTARLMGGVAGHAGVFTTVTDLARYARMLLNEGVLDGVRLFKPETVRLMTTVQSAPEVQDRRGLGWDIDSGYSRPRGKLFPLGSYGHTGWTGTCLWIDPFSRSFWIFLSNRVHPNGQGNVLELQSTLATLAAEAIADFDFSYVQGALPPRVKPGPSLTAKATGPQRTANSESKSPLTTKRPALEPAVLNGIDVLVQQGFAPLKGLKIGLISNHTGIDRQRNPTIDLLHAAPEVSLKVLFSPEHGLRGDRDERIEDSVDSKTGLPIHSLYGKTRRPAPDQLKDLDALVFDIQDVGCRFYTYITTLGYCMEAASQARLRFFVLDRVNPINGETVDGPVLADEPSFTAYHTLPLRPGLTVGELARLYNLERDLQTDLTVIPISGWKRKWLFDQTGLPWTNPSPNMRSLTEAILYPGVGLLETTALSVGRGTGTPFEVVGAPYIDDVPLAAELNQAGLEGVRFVPVRFTPTASVYKDELCAGVSILLTDRERCRTIDIGLTIAQILHQRYPQHFDIEKFNRLLGHPATIAALKEGKTLGEIRQLWAQDLKQFEPRRKACLLY